MKHLIASITFSLACSIIFAQQTNGVELKTGKVPKAAEVDFSDTSVPDFNPVIVNVKEQPKPASDLKNKKEILHQQRLATQSQGVKKNAARGASPEPPLLITGFNANVAQGTPNDNHIAISNDGIIVSVVNTNIRMYDTLGNLRPNGSRSLQNFSSSLGSFTQNSDPRVIYDPVADRFIIVFFSGSSSATNKVVLAFSKTKDPTGQWNLYALPGNYLNDTTWSDYPIVSISKSDLFMTFNQLKDNEDWKTGFRYSIIWQIDKNKGYSGDTLAFNYWSKPTHNAKPIWSMCPVMEGNTFTSDEAYFLSVRPSDFNNDTVFLHTVTNTQQSGTAQFNTRVLKTNAAYGLAPNAIQPDGQQLATNDARVLHAFINGNRIYYAQNCIVPGSNNSGIYLGRIENPSTANPSITGQIIGYDTVDLGYPSFAHIGKNNSDHRCFMTCSFVSSTRFAGTAAFYIDNNSNVSDMTLIRKGDNNLDELGDTVERWGDYTGIQRRYNEDFTAWLAGSYTRISESNGAWVAKVTTEDSMLISAIKDITPSSFTSNVFPNPSSDRFEVLFESEGDNFTSIQLFDMQGRLVTTLIEDKLKAGTNRLSFSTKDLAKGSYLLRITANGNFSTTKRIQVH